MNRNRDDLTLAGFRIDVVTTFNALKQPTIVFEETAHLRPRDRFHTATSRIWMFASGLLPCFFITSSTPEIASLMFSINSSIVWPCE